MAGPAPFSRSWPSAWLKSEPRPLGRDALLSSRPWARRGTAPGWPLLAGVVLVLSSAPGSLPWKRPAPAWVGCTGGGGRHSGLGGPQVGAPRRVKLCTQVSALCGWSRRLRGDRQGPGSSRPASGQQVSPWLGRLGTQSHGGDTSLGFHRQEPQLSGRG